MYYVETIGVVSLVIYLLSLAGSRIGILGKKAHRSFWNVILLITFITTAAAGIFLALQANYKWDITGVEKILRWHVNFGLGFSFTAIFHITWHLGYYLKLVSPKEKKRDEQFAITDKIPALKYMQGQLFILGFLSSSVQVIFLREIINLSGGYELVTGSVLFTWLLLTAMGSFLVRGRIMQRLGMIFTLLPAAAIISFVLLNLAYRLLTTTGETPSLVVVIILSIIALLPFCTLSGFLFVGFSRTAGSQGKDHPGKSFASETIGGVAAGLIISMLAYGAIDNYRLLILVSVAALSGIVYFNIPVRRKLIFTVLASLVIISVIINPDRYVRKAYFRKIPIISSHDSRYGNLTIADYYGQKTLFYNHQVFNNSEDISLAEENIHAAMIQHPFPKSVLLISGGLRQHIPEIMKYKSVCEVTYLDLDPALIALERNDSIAYDSLKIELKSTDPFRFLKRADYKWDVVICLLPSPSSFMVNRFYTSEFISLVKSRLNNNGIFSIRTSESMNYHGNDLISYLSSVFVPLKKQFHNIIPYRGYSNFFIASDSSLSFNYDSLFKMREITNIYFNSGYIDGSILEFNADRLVSSFDTTLRANSLEHPRALFYNQSAMLKKHGRVKAVIIASVFALSFLMFLFFGTRRKVMFIASFSAASTEILAIILFQSALGYLYQAVGMIIALTMLGLAAGAAGLIKKRYMTRHGPLILIIVLLVPVLFPGIIITGMGLTAVLYIILIAFMSAYIAGNLYRRFTGNVGSRRGNTISAVYVADLSGAALGFLLFSGLVIPVTGISACFLILAIINIVIYLTSSDLKNE